MEIREKAQLWTLGTVPVAIQHFAVSNLHLSWIGEEYVSNGFRSYVKFNEATGLLASGAGIRHSGNMLEIYDAETMELKLKHETDTSSCWCMSWLPDGHYVTGSNDSLIRIWTDGVVQHT